MDIRIRVGGIWVSGRAVLLQSLAGTGVWGVPDARLEDDESLREACERGYEEETGVEVECASLAFADENMWDENGTLVREYSFYFWTAPRHSLPESKPRLGGPEGHVRFRWFDLDKLNEVAVAPAFLKEVLPRLGRETLFVESREPYLCSW